MENFFNINPYDILASLIFSTIGIWAFHFGKRHELWKPRAIGVLLMVYSYFYWNTWYLWGVGSALCLLLYFQHDE